MLIPYCGINRSAGLAGWFVKGRAMFYYVYVVMNVKGPQLSVLSLGHHVPVAGFCLPLYSLRVLQGTEL